jgi:leucyl-tRNA synthetase
MICVNELSSQNCKSKSIIEPLLILLSPFAPHISEELWEKLGNTESILNAQWPEYDESQLVESVKLYPISINGKTRTQIEFPLDMDRNTISEKVLEDEVVQKWLEGKAPKKIIVVPGRIVNLVI